MKTPGQLSVKINSQRVEITDFAKLADLALFDPGYLHLEDTRV